MITEVIGAVAIRFIDGFARWLPRAVVAVRYAVSYCILALVHQHDMPIGIVSGRGLARWRSLRWG